MNEEQIREMIKNLLADAREARSAAEALTRKNPAFRHFHGAADSMFYAVESLEQMLPNKTYEAS